MAAQKRQDASMDVMLNGVTVDGKIVPWAVAFPRVAPAMIPCRFCGTGMQDYGDRDICVACADAMETGVAA